MKLDILYEQEVTAFLKEFLFDPERYPEHTPPESIGQVLQDIRDIWAADPNAGYLMPDDLRNILMRKYLSVESDFAIFELVKELGEKRFARRDHLTDYMQKSELSIVTGLADLYADSSDQSCAIIEVDYSNMGGTNNFFQQLLADAWDVPFDEVDPKEAHMLTDKAAFIVAQKIIEQIKKSCGDRSMILPVRAGGDELRIMVTDVDQKELKRMRARIHHSIELSMAALGLHDHPHAKAPNDPVKRGFGAAVSVMDMRDIEPAFYTEQADAKIDVEKRILGAYRLGQLPPQEIMLKMVFDKVVPYYDGSEPIQDVLANEASTRHGAYQRLKKAHGTCPLQGRSGLELLRNICRQMDEQIAQLDLTDDAYDDPFSIWDNHDRSLANAKTFYQSIKQRNLVKLTSILNDLEVDTDVYELAYLIISMSDLSPEDPAAQVNMPRDLPETLELYLEDLERHKVMMAEAVHNEDEEGQKVIQALCEAGMDFQDLESLSPMLLGVSMHNLAGLNKLLGHENADKALKFMAHDVMKKTLMDHGMGDDDYFLAHYGGGEFVALIEPVIQQEQGALLIPNAERVERVQAQIRSEIKALNDMPIQGFLKRLDMRLERPSDLADQNITHTSDIVDGKGRTWLQGIDVTCHHERISDLFSGSEQAKSTGHMLSRFRMGLENAVEAHRDQKQKSFEAQASVRHQVKAAASKKR